MRNLAGIQACCRVFSVTAFILLGGCIFGPSGAHMRQVELQVDRLEQRVGRLELVLSGGGGGSAGGGSISALVETPDVMRQETPAVSLSAGPRGEMRWPGLPRREAWGKLFRGAANVVTGWVELPKRIHETTLGSGPGTGATWGILRGIGYGFVRTLGGVYEIITFPFPAPPDYRPVMRPAYVFLCE